MFGYIQVTNGRHSPLLKGYATALSQIGLPPRKSTGCQFPPLRRVRLIFIIYSARQALARLLRDPKAKICQESSFDTGLEQKGSFKKPYLSTNLAEYSSAKRPASKWKKAKLGREGCHFVCVCGGGATGRCPE